MFALLNLPGEVSPSVNSFNEVVMNCENQYIMLHYLAIPAVQLHIGQGGNW